MPQTDSRGQGIPFPTLKDRPNARTFGENLVEAVAPKLVMRFPSESVRGATIPNPEPGMMTWIEDIAQLAIWDGDQWAAVASGQTVWQTIQLANGYEPNGNENGTPGWRLVDLFGAPTVMLRGGVFINYQNGVAPNGGVITNVPLPPYARPQGARLRSVSVACSTISSVVNNLKLDADDQGHLRLVGFGNDKPSWVSLNGVFYSL